MALVSTIRRRSKGASTASVQIAQSWLLLTTLASAKSCCVLPGLSALLRKSRVALPPSSEPIELWWQRFAPRVKPAAPTAPIKATTKAGHPGRSHRLRAGFVCRVCSTTSRDSASTSQKSRLVAIAVVTAAIVRATTKIISRSS